MSNRFEEEMAVGQVVIEWAESHGNQEIYCARCDDSTSLGSTDFSEMITGCEEPRDIGAKLLDELERKGFELVRANADQE